MDTKAIEKFSIEAREQLLKDVEQRLYIYGLDDAGRSEFGVEADAVRGTVLTATEKRQRTELFRRIEQEGTLPFITEMAYTWFNRFAAIRYMELHDFLPSHVRMLSAADGSFEPECLKAATTLDLPGLDRMEIAQLIQTGDDERLYRVILIAQCDELASFLPSVFGTVTADALTMPANLLRKNEFNALYRLVTDIPESEWQDVEILGWMYQFYNSEVKAEFFKSKRKAAAEDIAPATQLFTPEWIVRYMVDNSLGRLWMLNHPESRLRDHARAENSSDRLMEYYIEPDEEHEDFIQVTSPEDITFCDPACGSGHILVYAFKMLMAIYEECGYREREIPELILTKNLSGFEIDPRAAQIATLALALCAREHDRRFFDRGIAADITVLQNIEIDTGDLLLTSPLREKSELLENLAHLGEIGSLLQPSDEDITALEADLIDAVGDNLFTSHANKEVERALATCRALARRFDVVVTNPPYMGPAKMNPWLSAWIKKQYSLCKDDLCYCFISRCLAFGNCYSALITKQGWMFDSRPLKLRRLLLEKTDFVSILQLSPGAFETISGEVVKTSAVIMQSNDRCDTYARMSTTFFDLSTGMESASSMESALKGAISGERTGDVRHQVRTSSFLSLEDCQLVCWLSDAMLALLNSTTQVRQYAVTRHGLVTGSKDLFVRNWFEVERATFSSSGDEMLKWHPYNKGGSFRRWYGNREHIVNWENSGEAVRNYRNDDGEVVSSNYNLDYVYRSNVTWSDVRSNDGVFSARFTPYGSLFDTAGPSLFAEQHDLLVELLGLLNSSVCNLLLSISCRGLHYSPGSIGKLPAPKQPLSPSIRNLVTTNIELSRDDYNSQETSWDFKRNPLI